MLEWLACIHSKNNKFIHVGLIGLGHLRGCFQSNRTITQADENLWNCPTQHVMVDGDASGASRHRRKHIDTQANKHAHRHPQVPLNDAGSCFVMIWQTKVQQQEKKNNGIWLYSSVAEHQSCKLNVLGSIPSGGLLLATIVAPPLHYS